MNAIRQILADEELDNIHSIYADQWDWGKVIDSDQRNSGLLENTVKKIYERISEK